MPTTAPPRPYTPGHVAGLTLYAEGPVEHVDADTVTIAGHRLPLRLGGPIRHLSTQPPPSPDDTHDCTEWCTREHVTDDRDSSDELDALDELEVATRRRHDDEHPDPLRFCPDPVCRALDELEDAR
ncbi:hypothetical protein [Georgenia sp. MJ170]|uniref:hypothetical protein n=1 Tax=Georgenia sunbinii TaxID=3117728 RepID=UPI002F25F66C